MKALAGAALIVTGGALVFGAVVGGFISGVCVDQWMTKANEETDGPKPTMWEPATGTDLPLERQETINNSTVSSPITLTADDVEAMELNYVTFGVTVGRFKLDLT